MTLVVVPVFVRSQQDLEVTVKTIESVRATEPQIDVMLVDDGSPARDLVDELDRHRERLQFELRRNRENQGFSRTVNVGLREALEREVDAVLLNADVELLTPDWSRTMKEQLDSGGRPAAVVGALLVYPGGELIQHAGVYFSFITRLFDHRFRFAPASLPEANIRCCCPVTGALQFISLECLQTVGIYDPKFRMAWEDVDYCLRVFASGRECIYCPEVKAIHYESLFRGRADRKLTDWQQQSLARLLRKHAGISLGQFCPEMV